MPRGRPRPRPADSLLNAGGSSNEWAIAAALEPLDKVAFEVEAKWGCGQLERLVSPETAAKFASARKKLDEAIEANSWEEVAKRASVLIRGWNALEAEATNAGHQPADLDRFWCVESDDGTRYVFVMHERDAHVAVKRFPDHIVYSMREVVRMLGSEFSLVARTKSHFPGATVAAVKRTIPDPLRGIHDTKARLDDELPW